MNNKEIDEIVKECMFKLKPYMDKKANVVYIIGLLNTMIAITHRAIFSLVFDNENN